MVTITIITSANNSMTLQCHKTRLNELITGFEENRVAVKGYAEDVIIVEL